jgi:hypothetical protein
MNKTTNKKEMGGITMKTIACVAGALLALTASIDPGLAQAPKSGIERMYVLYCGDIALTDMGRFSPGYSGPGALSSTCYLFKHTQGWLLWDTGLGDAIASMPEGQKSNAGVWHVKKHQAHGRKRPRADSPIGELARDLGLAARRDRREAG